MFPILFEIGGFSFSSLGFLLGLGFFVAFFIVWRRLKEIGIEEEKAVDIFLFSSLAGILLSRISYIGLNFVDFRFNLTKWFYLNRFPGFSFWGALLGFLLGFTWFALRQKWNLGKVADELVFGLAPFSVLVHLGMFLDGSGLGGETGMFWGLFFPGDIVRRHPVSFFQAFLFLCFWLCLIKIERIWRSWDWYKSKKEGFLILVFLIFTFLSQFLLAFLKPTSLYSGVLERTGSFLLLLGAIGCLYRCSGRKIEEDWLFFKKFPNLRKEKTNGVKKENGN